MSEKYDPSSDEMKELLEVNIVDEMQSVLKAIDDKIEPEIMEHLDWAIRAIQVRLLILEGNVSILQQSHLNHTNSDPVEFENMHGLRLHQVRQEESGIARAIEHTVALRDLIGELRESDDASDYDAVTAMVTMLARAAGLEVKG